MDIGIKDWVSKWIGASPQEVCVRELMSAGEEYQARALAFNGCVNLIANAIGRCDFRTYRNGKEIREKDHYLWNFEPNVNQNSSAFWHKAVYTLYLNNEALIVPLRRRDGQAAYGVADSWAVPDPKVTRMDEYKGVTVGPLTYDRNFREEEVIHLKLNQERVKPVVDGLAASYGRLLTAAMNNYQWANGQHWKVTVDQIAAGRDRWQQDFQKMIEEQIKPFLNAGNAVLPEWNGYKYEQLNKATDAQRDATHIKNLIQDIFDFTANAFLIPPVLLRGQVEGVGDANNRFLTNVIDPLADQITEEMTRKLYGYDGWRRGSYLRVDTSAIQHFNLFDLAPNIEKLIGCGYSYNDLQRAAGGQEIDEPWANAHFMTKNFDLAMRLLNGEEDNSDGTNPKSGGNRQAGGEQ